MDRVTYQREYYQSNRETLNAYCLAWRNRERFRLIDELGGRCVHCGESDVIVLDFDHINDDGNQDKGNVIHHVKKNPERFQLLCKNCNWRKEYGRRKDARSIEIAS